MQNIIPWLIISSSIGFLVSSALTFKYWRDSKKSPFFFLRRQAEQNMQTYSFSSIVCAVILLFLVTYAQQPVQDTTLRVVNIVSAKPALTANSASPADEAETAAAVEDDAPEIVELSGSNISEIATDLIVQQSENLNQANALTPDIFGDEEAVAIEAERAPTLPDDYDQFEATAELSPSSFIGTIDFSTEIDEFELIALSPERVFEEGSFTIYATFEYDGLEDGMVWSWVWRRDGQVVSGGNEVWVYGVDGPGYVFYNPREGFQEGEYALEIWVNQELMSEANLFITSDIAASR